MALYLGLMSGTSLDAIDTAIVDIHETQVQLLHSSNLAIPSALKNKIQILMSDNGKDNVNLLGEVDTQLGIVFAEAANNLIKTAQLNNSDITAIGSHGQTIRHHPNREHGFSLQIGDANRIAALTNITTVADFRRRDIALGGQGAPLVPAFHRAIFSDNKQARCAVNIGGMANITYLPSGEKEATAGFDTGPGNILLDSWCQQHTGKNFDKSGDWARSGKLPDALFQTMLADKYFALDAPKSTGREYFNNEWLAQFTAVNNESAENVQRCLTELTAKTIIDAIDRYYPKTEQLIICGGGYRNTFLVERLQNYFGDREVVASTVYGIEPDWIEAAAFAWLAHRTLNNLSGNEPTVTGASNHSILGAIYPA